MRTKCAISYVSSEIAFLRFSFLWTPDYAKQAMMQNLLVYVSTQRTEFDGCPRVIIAQQFDKSDI